jgi:acyl dehydratase
MGSREGQGLANVAETGIAGFAPGDRRSMPICLEEDAVRRFVEFSGDDAPLHTDEDYARRSGFDGVVVHGALLAAHVSRFVGTRFPGPRSVLQRMDLQFRAPCHAPCKLTLEAEVRQVSAATRSLVLDLRIVGEGEDTLVTGRTVHLVLDEPR